MSYSIEPACLVRDELIRKIILASTSIENQWFFSNGAFNANLYISQSIDTWNHEEFAVVHDKQIIAYFSATWDRPLDIIQSFRMIFFDKSKSYLAAHEIEHQSQYQNGDKKEVFETLVNEALDKASGKSDPYNTSGTLEYKAQQVQERANKILESRSMTW